MLSTSLARWRAQKANWRPKILMWTFSKKASFQVFCCWSFFVCSSYGLALLSVDAVVIFHDWNLHHYLTRLIVSKQIPRAFGRQLQNPWLLSSSSSSSTWLPTLLKIVYTNKRKSKWRKKNKLSSWKPSILVDMFLSTHVGQEQGTPPILASPKINRSDESSFSILRLILIWIII